MDANRKAINAAIELWHIAGALQLLIGFVQAQRERKAG